MSRRPVLVAPDAFKGTMSAEQVAAAIARGLESAGAGPVDPCPIADGGEGTLDVLLGALGGERREAEVADPLGRPIRAAYALLADGRGLVEMAHASGLGLVAAAERDPEVASTRGTGELIAAARAAGAHEVLVAVGGSATTDGGAGALQALAGVGEVGLTVLCDVATPFERAAELFARQKGADAAGVQRLTARLHAQAAELPRDPRGVPGTGAAGGLAGGLWAAHGARLVPGAAWVLDALGFDARVRAARWAITGEGRLDATSRQGKAVSEVARRCRSAGVALHALVGQDALGPAEARRAGLASVHEAGDPEALANAARELAAQEPPEG